VLLITSGLLTIAAGIFNFLTIELRISGELADSFYAIYAADEGMERALYDERIQGLYPDPGVFTIQQNISNGSCYTATITKTAISTDIKVVGKYQCSGSISRQLQRSLQAGYQ
jgi:hypothetical protein